MRGAGIPPAHMEPHPLRRDPLKRPVQSLDRQRKMMMPIPHAGPHRPRVRRHRHIRRIDLQTEPRLHNRPILISQRLSARRQIPLMRPVMLIGIVERDLTRTDRAHKPARRIATPQRPLEPGDIPMHRILISQLHRPHAIRKPQMRRLRIREQPHRQLRKRRHIIRLKLRPPTKPREPLRHIRTEPRLAHLPITNHIQPHLPLPSHQLHHRISRPRLKLPLINHLPIHPRPHQIRQLIRPRQTPRMRRQNPISHHTLTSFPLSTTRPQTSTAPNTHTAEFPRIRARIVKSGARRPALCM